MNPASIPFDPIGIIYSEHVDPRKTPIQPVYAQGSEGRVEVFSEFAEGLIDLEGFSHIFLLYLFDRSERCRLTVKPYLEDVDHGVFATRAPCRPNPIGISVVRLDRREGNILHVSDLDILTGTPLLDIKPYSAKFDRVETTRNGWQDKIDDETARKKGKRRYSPSAEIKLAPPIAFQSYEEAVRFHGHSCPGLAIGYRVAKEALSRLEGLRSTDEEIIAIVENDSCAVDAIQCLTGCTFGKGNFFFRDYGKHAYTFALRPTGQAVRILVKPRSLRRTEPSTRYPETQLLWMLAAPVDEFLTVQSVTIDLPQPAQRIESVICEACGEEVMATRTIARGSSKRCIPCSRKQTIS